MAKLFLFIVLFFGFIQAGLAHNTPAISGSHGYQCIGDAVGHILSGNQCLHPTAEQAKELAESAQSVTGPDTVPFSPKTGCPAGYSVDGANANLCRKTICPQGQFFDTNNKQCVSTTPTLGTINLNEYQLTYKIPCVVIDDKPCPEATGPAEYIARIYRFSLMIVGLVALVFLTFGALKYVLSAGKIADQSDAKEQMLAAVYGLLILLGAYLILRTINPELVNLRNPSPLPISLPPAARHTPPSPAGNANPVPVAPAPTPSPANEAAPPPVQGVPPTPPTPAPTAYPTQTHCLIPLPTDVVNINGTEYAFCASCENGYTSVIGVCTDIVSLIDPSDPHQDNCITNLDGTGGNPTRGAFVGGQRPYKYACESNGCLPGHANINGVCE